MPVPVIVILITVTVVTIVQKNSAGSLHFLQINFLKPSKNKRKL